jgi:hypothetical protein
VRGEKKDRDAPPVERAVTAIERAQRWKARAVGRAPRCVRVAQRSLSKVVRLTARVVSIAEGSTVSRGTQRTARHGNSRAAAY